MNKPSKAEQLRDIELLKKMKNLGVLGINHDLQHADAKLRETDMDRKLQELRNEEERQNRMLSARIAEEEKKKREISQPKPQKTFFSEKLSRLNPFTRKQPKSDNATQKIKTPVHAQVSTQKHPIKINEDIDDELEYFVEQQEKEKQKEKKEREMDDELEYFVKQQEKEKDDQEMAEMYDDLKHYEQTAEYKEFAQKIKNRGGVSKKRTKKQKKTKRKPKHSRSRRSRSRHRTK